MHRPTASPDNVRSTWLLRWPVVGTLLGCWVAMVALWSTLGWLVVDVFAESPVRRADDRLARWFVAQRTPRWDALSLLGSWLAETVVKIVVTAVVAVVLVRWCRRWLEALVVAVSLLLEAMVFITVTLIVGRDRPDVPRLDGSPVGSSFPSGHVAAAACYTALAVVLFWHTRKILARALLVTFSAVIPVVVAAARMYRGMHFLTDVVAGMLLGLTSVAVVTIVLQRAEAKRVAERADRVDDDGSGSDGDDAPLAPVVPIRAARRELSWMR